MTQKALENGVLLMIYHEDKTVEEILVSKESIYIAKKKVENQEIIIPVISLNLSRACRIIKVW